MSSITIRQLQEALADAGIRRFAGRLLLAAAVVTALSAQSCYWGFVQDDAYISLRYSRNLARGNGLVFNPGERVEGYTNFLWVLFGALFIRLGLEPLFALQCIGALSGLLLPLLVYRLSAVLRGRDEPCYDGLAALFVGGSTTVAIWSVSGLEETFFTLVGWAGLCLAVRGLDGPACLLFFVACLTRPEGILFTAIGVLLLLLRRRNVLSGASVSSPPGDDPSPGVGRGSLPAFVVLGLALAAYHCWRWSYFGDILPNTYYVKGGGGWAAFRFGLMNLDKLLSFDCNGLLLALSPVVLLSPRRRVAYLSVLLFLAVYLSYEVKVGCDILPLHRLHMVALPAQAVLAARALELIGRGLKTVVKREYAAAAGVAWTLVAASLAGWMSFVMFENARSHPEYAGVARSLDRAHGAIGRCLQRLVTPGDTAVAQDMGALPWNAPDVVFVDTIGLVDRTIAHVHYRAGYTPYIRYLLWKNDEARRRIRAMEARLRDYVFSRNPRWIVVNIDTAQQDHGKVKEALRARDGRFFQDFVKDNVFFYGLFDDARIRRYRFVKGWEYSAVHFLLLYERRQPVSSGDVTEVAPSPFSEEFPGDFR